MEARRSRARRRLEENRSTQQLAGYKVQGSYQDLGQHTNMLYQAKLKGMFTVTQQVHANSELEAREKFRANLGNDIETIAEDIPQITDFVELEG